MANSLIVVVFVCMLVANAVGDCYMQNPRGSNDRYNEEGDRQNANRLFDSENNARGGYCWGPSMKYYEGSILPIEWTAQHGCGGPHVTCQEIIQYMCDPNLRDGTETTTIPDDVNQYNAKNGDDTYRYGMMESYQSYQDCKARERNKGLFIADQNVGARAINTRQNAGGTRYGFECTEERDYYPYWHPSQWKDIAVLTDKMEHCAFYQAESQNVKAKNYCKLTPTGNTAVPNNEAACTAANGQWTSEPAFGIAAPECKLASFSRDNHLGNTLDGETANYTWVLPTAAVEPCIAAGTCNCAIRIRYNITTNESTGLSDEFLDSGDNRAIKNNPTLPVEGGEVTLALNTAQFGRTFQDRSYMFNILPRPANVGKTKKIYNLNVRGKRGNIVQTFPATEYDYTPGRLQVEQDDIIHFQWTGCDNNPAGNQGEGKVKTDRSNIIQIKNLDSNIPVIATNDTVEKLLFDDAFLRTRMALIDQKGCVPVATLLKNNNNDANAVNQLTENCAKLNAAPTPYFNGGLVKMNNTGKFTYMSSRNNNFSNRSQKGQITVTEKEKKPKSSGAVAGIVLACILISVAAIGALIFYGKRNPHSAIGRAIDRIPTPSLSRGPSGARGASLLSNDHGAN